MADVIVVKVSSVFWVQKNLVLSGPMNVNIKSVEAIMAMIVRNMNKRRSGSKGV